MAKRRKLEAPSADDLGRIEEEFRRETPAHPISAPIAQVAAESASAFQSATPEMRRDEAQAAAYRTAEGQGRLIKQIALQEIDATALQRDRTVMDPEALEELEYSIGQHGLRLPIEVYALPEPVQGKRYGLLSGYRRLIAQQNLSSRRGGSAFALIKAIVRDPDEIGGAFVAMVEENEIRAELSHFERGRIAAIAAQQGAFPTTEKAVAHMFAAASKAKRSKIRSFAMIFEELGDLLQFPESLREKDGLRLAQALRGGAETRLREVLGVQANGDAKSEWASIETVLAEQDSVPIDSSRGGRPRTTSEHSGWGGSEVLRTSKGLTLRAESDGKKGYLIRLGGRGVSQEMAEMLVQEIHERLEQD